MGTISSENNLKGKSYIAFFDLDDTLIRANSGKLLVRGAYEKGMMSLPDLIKALWLSFLYRFRLMDPEKIIAGMLKWLAGVPEKRVSDLSSEVFEKHMLQAIPEDARSEIKMHKDKNAAVVILSSALSPVCQVVAGHLEMDDVICTQIETDGGRCTGRTAGKLCFGNEKVSRLKEYCEKNNSKVEQAWYYGDSFSDSPVLQIVGNPVCVNPDKKLQKAANKNSWKIYLWK
ncbi:MAG: HAD-IB family hydrolase [Bacteroidia bacterium]|nr:HAD-IB family hydrolase [Bacteroidia bacterium]